MPRSLPHDPQLPQLACALDPQAMAAVFAALLDGVQVLGCAVERLKHRAGRSCSITYALRLRRAGESADFSQRVATRLCNAGASAARFVRAQQATLVASAAGPALSHLPALEMVAHWLPNDAKLAAMRLLCDDAALRTQCLPDVVAALTDGRGELVDHRLTLVQHVPELRVCARVDLQLRDAAGAVALHTVYAKADLERDGALTQHTMHTLHASPAQRAGLLRTPQPLLWQAESGLHWQHAAAGQALADADGPVGPVWSARVGAALAALHSTPVARLPAIDVAVLPARLHQAAEALCEAEPAWEALLAQAVRVLATGHAGLGQEGVATLHGDLHPRNILVDGTRLAFIDLDSLQAGPAVLELGGWIADTLYRGVLDAAPARQTRSACLAFLAAHAQAAGRVVDPALLAWCTAFDLVCKRASRCVTNLKPGRFEAVPQLLALATAIAATGDIDSAFAPELEAA